MFPLAVMFPLIDEKLGEWKLPLALMSPNTVNFLVGRYVPIPTLPANGFNNKLLLLTFWTRVSVILKSPTKILLTGLLFPISSTYKSSHLSDGEPKL